MPCRATAVCLVWNNHGAARSQVGIAGILRSLVVHLEVIGYCQAAGSRDLHEGVTVIAVRRKSTRRHLRVKVAIAVQDVKVARSVSGDSRSGHPKPPSAPFGTRSSTAVCASVPAS